MANLYPETAAQNWLDDTWKLTDDGGGILADPGVVDINDNAWFSQNSGAVTLTANTATFNDLDMSKAGGYNAILAMAAFDINANGNVTIKGQITADIGATLFCGGSFDVSATIDSNLVIVMNATTGAQTILTSGSTLGGLTINDASGTATFAMQDALTCGAFVLTDGDFRTGNNNFTCTTISGSAGELAFGTSTVTLSGIMTLDNITTTSNGATITATSIDLGGSGTFTLSGDTSLVGDFLLDGGTIDTGGNAFTVNGGVLYGGTGSVTELNLTMIGTNTLGWAVSGQKITELTTTGTITLSDTVWIRKLSGSGNIVTDGNIFYISGASAGWWTHTGGAGSISGVGSLVVQQQLVSPGGNIIVDVDTSFQTFGDTNIVLDGNITVGSSKTLRVYGSAAGNKYTVTMAAGKSVLCHDLKLGTTSANTGSGILTLGEGSVNTFDSVAMGHNDNDANAFGFAGSTTLTGIFNGNNQGTNPMTVTSTGANLHNGTLQNANVTGILHAWGVVDGGSNSIDVAHESSLGGVTVNVGTGIGIAA